LGKNVHTVHPSLGAGRELIAQTDVGRTMTSHKYEMPAMLPNGAPPSLDLGDEASYLDQPLDEAACSAGY
jgi:hypothetical protein